MRNEQALPEVTKNKTYWYYDRLNDVLQLIDIMDCWIDYLVRVQHLIQVAVPLKYTYDFMDYFQ